MRQHTRRHRGTATVEMAVGMIVFIPIFLYALFLDDLLRYRLDVQEATTTTAWDFASQNYNAPLDTLGASPPEGGRTALQHFARLMWCDHHSAIDSFQDERPGGVDDCTDQGKKGSHHSAVGAHGCWINSDAAQVTCEPPAREVAGSYGNPLANDFQGRYTQGGMFQCYAQLVVQNYLMPQKFLQNFSKVDLSLKLWGGERKEVHDNSRIGTRKDTYFLARQHFALLTDTWALTTTQIRNPGDKSNPGSSPADMLYNRMDSVFRGNPSYSAYKSGVDSLLGQAYAQDLLAPGLHQGSAGGDDPTTPNLAVFAGDDTRPPPKSQVEQEGGSAQYDVTPWQDWETDAHQKTWEARGRHYLGCTQAESC